LPGSSTDGRLIVTVSSMSPVASTDATSAKTMPA
jgi:hypothetical protein